MGSEINTFLTSENSKQNINQIDNINNLNGKLDDINDIYSINEDELFSIKGFKQHYILTLANMAGKNIILLGDSKIGKTNIFNILFEKEHLNVNNNNKNINGQNYAYFEEKIFIIEDLEININIWDTPGQETHKEANKHFIKDCIICYLCFHFKNSKSFENIKNYYIKLIKEINGENSFIVLVGIKKEIFDDDENNDNIPINIIKKFAKDYNILFYSVSLNDSNSVRYLFNDSIKKYILFQSKISFQNK